MAEQVKPIPVSSCPCKEGINLEFRVLFHDKMMKNVIGCFAIDKGHIAISGSIHVEIQIIPKSQGVTEMLVM